MLQDLRNQSKIIIYIIAFVFIVGMFLMGAGSIFNKQPVLGKINGKKITYKKFYKMLQNNYSDWQSKNEGKETDEKIMQQLRDQTWEQMIQFVLLDQEIKKRHIKVKDEDVIKKLKDPSSDITQIPELQTDGKFDYSKYEKMLYDNDQFGTYIESRVRANLPYQLLFDDIVSDIEFDEEKVKQDYIDKNDKADAKVIYFDYKQYKDVVAEESEVQKYYDEHKEDYKKGAARKLRYVKIPFIPSVADEKIVKDSINFILEKIKAGEDFATLAKQYSQGPSAPKGGDLGYFDKTKMVKEFSAVAFNTEIGQVSKPVKTKFGWHIIKVFAKRKNAEGADEIKASHILLKVNPSEKTKLDLETKIAELKKNASKVGLEKAAKDLAYDVSETKEFYENSTYISGLGKQEELVKFAFANKVGSFADPIEGRDKEKIFCEVSYEIGEHYQTLEEVKTRIENSVKNIKKAKKANEKGEEFVKANKPEDYLKIAEKEGIQIIDLKGVNKDKYVPKVGKIEALNKAILETEPTHFTPLIKDEAKGAFLAYVETRTKADMTKFEETKEALIETAKTNAKNTRYNEWYNDAKEKAKIIDNREMYF